MVQFFGVSVLLSTTALLLTSMPHLPRLRSIFARVAGEATSTLAVKVDGSKRSWTALLVLDVHPIVSRMCLLLLVLLYPLVANLAFSMVNCRMSNDGRLVLAANAAYTCYHVSSHVADASIDTHSHTHPLILCVSLLYRMSTDPSA
jgi:hypothetical protein